MAVIKMNMKANGYTTNIYKITPTITASKQPGIQSASIVYCCFTPKLLLIALLLLAI
jgi:hypothetical protein